MNNSRAKNLVKYVLPTTLGSVSFFLFTIIDGIFVGRGVGTNALGAVNIVFPFVMFVNAIFQLSTIGGITVVAIRFGRGDNDGANQAFMHSLSITVILSTLLCALGLLLTGPICRLLGAGDTFFSMTRDYLFWYSIFIIPSGLSMALQGFCRNDGSPILVSGALIFASLLNIFGDWLLIFPLKMGLAGAAIATGVSQTVVFFILLTHFIFKHGKLRIKRFKVQGALCGKILMRGLPECISQFATPVTTLWINKVLISTMGDTAINAYSIICYVASFSVAIFIGTSEGLQPLFGNCYGAKDSKGLKYYLRAGLIINVTGGVIIDILLLIFGSSICRLFAADEAALTLTLKSMPIYSIGFITMACNAIISAYLYSTKRTRQANIISILRSFVVNTAAILILPAIFGSGIVWYTFFIYETIVLVIAAILLRHSERNGIVYR